LKDGALGTSLSAAPLAFFIVQPIQSEEYKGSGKNGATGYLLERR
jgi:hypothetical protein